MAGVMIDFDSLCQKVVQRLVAYRSCWMCVDAGLGEIGKGLGICGGMDAILFSL
jgi:hypothetical protein